jgi:hypothetical protein
MRKLCRLNIALVAAAALTAAAWSAPAAANGERPTRATMSDKGPAVAAPKKVRRAAVRKRMSAVTRLPVIPASRWIEPSYERIIAPWRLLIVGIQY